MPVVDTWIGSTARNVTRAAHLARPAGGRILCFHNVAPLAHHGSFPRGTCITPDALRRMLDRVLDSPAEVVALRDFDPDDRAPTIVLTFDDASVNFLEHSLPALEERRLPATVFACTDYFDDRGLRWPDYPTDAPPPISSADARELHARGIAVGSHGHRHVDLRMIAPIQLSKDLGRSLAAVRSIDPTNPGWLAYPFGLADATVRSVAAGVGFRHAYSVGPGRSRLAHRRALREATRILVSTEDRLHSALDGEDDLLGRLRLEGMRLRGGRG